MPLKSYDNRADYDSDYTGQIFRTPPPVTLPVATIIFEGKTLRPSPAWGQVLQGGELWLSLGPDHPCSTIARVADVSGGLIMLAMPGDFPNTVEEVGEGQAFYAVPQVRCAYLSCVLRNETYLVMDALVAALGMRPPATVSVIGCAMGWEVERLIDLGFNAIGSDTSPWVHAEKLGSETAAVDEALVAAGYDPTRGQGAAVRAAMLAQPRSRFPEKVLNEDISVNASRNRIRNALGLSGNQRATWSITIGTMQALRDQTAVAVNNGMLNAAQNVAHHITVLPDVAEHWNRKTAEQWKALLQPALIVPHGDAARGYQVL